MKIVMMGVGGVGIAAARGIQMSSHLFPEVSAYLLAVTPTAHWLEYVDWAAPVLEEPMRIADGFALPLSGPGTGLAWNAEAVESYRIR